VRRGLLKDLANTATAMACGYRLYGEIQRLLALDGHTVTIDLLNARSAVDGEAMVPPLGIANDVTAWMRERLERDGIPPGLVTAARLTLVPHAEDVLRVECRTIVETVDRNFESADTATWSKRDA
jgi:hypothetical protein